MARLIPRSQTAGFDRHFDLFEVSPDEKVVVFPANNERVGILYLETGSIHWISEGKKGKTQAEDVRTVPT